jgi:GGDEF domain-containing protein
MRSCDLIIRMGGDEFLCALSDSTTDVAAERFEAVQAALATQERPRAFRAGIAELASGDSLTALIERADAQLAGNRRR